MGAKERLSFEGEGKGGNKGQNLSGYTRPVGQHGPAELGFGGLALFFLPLYEDVGGTAVGTGSASR